MPDGHCAMSGEVIFVESLAGGCSGADGTSAKPYCAPNDAVSVLTAVRRVIVIRGAVAGVTLNTTGKSPILIGRKNSAGDVGSIGALGGNAVEIDSDNVSIRDLIVGAGLAAGAKGFLIKGASTTAALLRVTASLGTGLGIDAETGSALVMDRCLVQNNSAGGVLVNGATYSVANSIIAANGLYGVKFSSTAIGLGSTFTFNTVVATSGNAVTCDTSNPQTIGQSIISGGNDSCSLANSITTPPTFSGTRPYHLTAHLAAPLPRRPSRTTTSTVIRDRRRSIAAPTSTSLDESRRR
jgi:hypothetical protein